MPISSLGLRLPEVPKKIITTRLANGSVRCERIFSTYWTKTAYNPDGFAMWISKGNTPKNK